jgi:hypothetical protein
VPLKKKASACFFVFLVELCLRANGSSVVTVERQAHRATVNVVLVCSFALTVVHAGRTITDIRRALSLRKLEAAVAALEERAWRRDIRAAR